MPKGRFTKKDPGREVKIPFLRNLVRWIEEDNRFLLLKSIGEIRKLENGKTQKENR